MKSLYFILSLASFSSVAQAAVTFTQTFNVSTVVPDNDSRGIANYQTITAGENGTPAGPDISVITRVSVDLNFSGGWNGDLYAYLVHESGYCVLINRIGREPGSPFGSSGTGMSITLSDNAAADVHTASFGNGMLTGTYQPDGRETDPDLVLGSDPRTAFLSSFNGLNAAGEWVLFVADLGSGDQSTLESWSLTITAIPEPSVLLLLPTGLMVLLRRRRN